MGDDRSEIKWIISTSNNVSHPLIEQTKATKGKVRIRKRFKSYLSHLYSLKFLSHLKYMSFICLWNYKLVPINLRSSWYHIVLITDMRWRVKEQTNSLITFISSNNNNSTILHTYSLFVSGKYFSYVLHFTVWLLRQKLMVFIPPRPFLLQFLLVQQILDIRVIYECFSISELDRDFFPLAIHLVFHLSPRSSSLIVKFLRSI